MSLKSDEIDLNTDAVSTDRENEVRTLSVAETLKECSNGEVQAKEEVSFCNNSAEVISDLISGGNYVCMSSEGTVFVGKEENECLDRGVDVNVEEGLNSCEICGCEVEAVQVVERGSREVDMEHHMNVDHVGEVVEQGSDVLDRVVEMEKENEVLHRGGDAKVEENLGRCDDDDDVSVAVFQVAVEMDSDMNVGSVGEVMDQGSDVLDNVIDVEKGNGYLDRGVAVKAEQSIGTCQIDVSAGDENVAEAAQVAERDADEGEMGRNVNVASVGEVTEQGIDVTVNLSSFDMDTVKPLPHNSNEATSNGFEDQLMEMDTHGETNGDQLVNNVRVSGAGPCSSALNESGCVNLCVDLYPYTSKDGNVSGDVNTKLVASNAKFRVNDLVWGKVRSHPWWPGQIIDPSAASQQAKRYFKKGGYLIAYFGDQTFAWNEVSRIKHFRQRFTQLEKQITTEDLQYALYCALEEVSRRVEFGLACSCIPGEAYAKIKTQVIVNAGIREGSSKMEGGDSYSNAASFNPLKLFDHIKVLARTPCDSGVNRLEFVTIKAQLSAFYRWKGYLHLPEFNMLGGLLDSEAQIPLSVEVKHNDEVTHNAEVTQNAPDFKDDKQVFFEKGKSESQDGSSHKRKHISRDSNLPSKKEKTLLDILTEKRANILNAKRGSHVEGDKFISSSSVKKRKEVDSISDEMAVKHKKSDSFSNNVTGKHEKSDLSIRDSNKRPLVKQSFGVGDSILKVASLLNGSSPIFKGGDGMSPKTTGEDKSKEKSLFRKSHSKMHFPSEKFSPDELLSQLCLAARNPMKGCNFLTSLVGFFSEFRNSVNLGKDSWEEVSGDKTGKILMKSGTTETFELEHAKDSDWTDRIIQSNPDEQLSLENKNEATEVLHELPSQKDIPPVEPQPAVQLSPDMESGPQTSSENHELKAVNSADPSDGCCKEDRNPTALVLNFKDSDSVPSKENLNKIFSRFGPLHEFGTEVLKSRRAKVVFKRRADAETAFSSAGKYRIFGPSLVSYCLKYMPSTPSKGSSCSTKRSRKSAPSVEGNASSSG